MTISYYLRGKAGVLPVFLPYAIYSCYEKQGLKELMYGRPSVIMMTYFILTDR